MYERFHIDIEQKGVYDIYIQIRGDNKLEAVKNASKFLLQEILRYEHNVDNSILKHFDRYFI